MSYRVFTRTWWREATANEHGRPDNLIPCPGRKHTIAARVSTEAEAQEICERYNSTHKPGRYSRKAEYMEN